MVQHIVNMCEGPWAPSPVSGGRRGRRKKEEEEEEKENRREGGGGEKGEIFQCVAFSTISLYIIRCHHFF